MPARQLCRWPHRCELPHQPSRQRGSVEWFDRTQCLLVQRARGYATQAHKPQLVSRRITCYVSVPVLHSPSQKGYATFLRRSLLTEQRGICLVRACVCSRIHSSPCNGLADGCSWPFRGISVTVRCAAVAGHGCDGSEAMGEETICAQAGGSNRCNCTSPYVRFGSPSLNLWTDWLQNTGNVFCNPDHFGVDPAPGQEKICQCSPSSWGVADISSRCVGCAGPVIVNVSGIGEYNASHLSTCSTCSCDTAGVPHRPFKNRLPSVWQEFIFDNNESPQVSWGNWSSTGDCTYDNVTGSGQCDCNQTNGSVLTPLGPWISSGNCSAPIVASEDHFIGGSGKSCGCSNRGEVQTPETTYNSTFDSGLSYISQWEVLADTSLSYVTSQSSSFNGELSYPRTYRSLHNATLSYATGYESTHNSSLSYVIGWETIFNSSKSHVIEDTNFTATCSIFNCSCSDIGISSTISPWGKDCGCGCVPASHARCTASNCSCSTTDTPDGVTATPVTHSPFGKSCGCGCREASRAYCSAANCSCTTTDTSSGVTATAVTHSGIGKSCGCRCEEASRAYCTAANCSCSFSIANQSGSVVTHSPYNYDCGCGCAAATHATCSLANCSCSTNYCSSCSGSPVTHSPIDKPCGCACKRKETSNCSSANCTCDTDGNPGRAKSFPCAVHAPWCHFVQMA